MNRCRYWSECGSFAVCDGRQCCGGGVHPCECDEDDSIDMNDLDNWDEDIADHDPPAELGDGGGAEGDDEP